MSVVVVSSYPPRHCGIGAYAATQVEHLKAEGEEVMVISPPDGDGDLRVPFFGGRPFREAAWVGRDAARIVVHFQPALYFRPRAPLSKVATSAALLALCRSRPQTEIVVHEADPPVRWRPDYALLRAAFRSAPVILFHTEREREELELSYGISVRYRIVPHTAGVSIRERLPVDEARRVLGIEDDRPVLVCPGFLHPDKGIERAVEAMSAVPDGRLYVVGSVKGPRNEAYARTIRSLSAQAPNVELVERFVDDVELDAWIAAADAVVLPYRRSWSSGILARAQSMGTPAIVTDVGGLGEQASAADTVVHDDGQLARALAEASGSRKAPR